MRQDEAGRYLYTRPAFCIAQCSIPLYADLVTIKLQIQVSPRYLPVPNLVQISAK